MHRVEIKGIEQYIGDEYIEYALHILWGFPRGKSTEKEFKIDAELKRDSDTLYLTVENRDAYKEIKEYMVFLHEEQDRFRTSIYDRWTRDNYL